MTITLQHLIALLPLLIVGLTVMVVMLSIAWRRNHKLNATLSIIGLSIALLSLYYSQAQAPIQVTTLFVVDYYAIFYMALVLFASLATCIFAYPWLKSYPDNKDEFYLLLLIATSGGLMLACSDHLASFFIGIELLSLPMFGLIGYAYRRRRSLEAAIKYMVLSATASSFLVFGMALLYAANGSLSFVELGNTLNLRALGAPIQLTGFGMMLVGFGFKLSLVPFQLWTPDVYEGAPAPVSGYLATVGKVAVFCVLARLLLVAPIASSHSVQFVLTLLAFTSILVGNVLALKQNNLKRILGYSSISHLGYLLVVLIGIQAIQAKSVDSMALNSSEAVGIYLVGYLLSSIVAFGVVALVSSPYRGEDSDMLLSFKGLFWQRPLQAICLTVMMLSLAGIPMTLGFIGKFYVIAIGIEERLWCLVAAVVVGSAMGLYYYLRVAVNLYHRRSESEGVISSSCSPLANIVLVVSTLLVLALGVYPAPLINLVRMTMIGM